MGSPLAAGLFQRAIPQSGAGHNALSPQKAAANAAAFARLAGLSRLAAAEGVIDMPFQPVVDGHFLAQRPIDAIRGGSARSVATLIGTTADEWKLMAAMFADEATEAALGMRAAALCAALGAAGRGDELVRTYRDARQARGEDSSPGELWPAIVTDQMFRVPADRLADAQAAAGAPTFAYVLDWKSPTARLGACHAIDLPLMFGTLREMAAFAGDSPAACELSNRMMDAWIAFARNGDPAAPSLPAWPPYSPPDRPKMLLGADCNVVRSYHEPERAFWDGLLG
jgi:para-nitrobenzyl esterase